MDLKSTPRDMGEADARFAEDEEDPAVVAEWIEGRSDEDEDNLGPEE